MKRIECNHCDDTVILADEPGESVVRGETPLEHMKRTGHSPRQPIQMQCNDCGNVWPYTGNADRPTCPHCHGKNVERAND